MILQFVKLKSNLPEKELLDRAKERQPQFEAIPGLVQKYYVKLKDEGYYGGIYVWDNKASLMDFKESDLAKNIPNAYEVVEEPTIDVMDIMFQLRND